MCVYIELGITATIAAHMDVAAAMAAASDPMCGAIATTTEAAAIEYQGLFTWQVLALAVIMILVTGLMLGCGTGCWLASRLSSPSNPKEKGEEERTIEKSMPWDLLTVEALKYTIKGAEEEKWIKYESCRNAFKHELIGRLTSAEAYVKVVIKMTRKQR